MALLKFELRRPRCHEVIGIGRLGFTPTINLAGGEFVTLNKSMNLMQHGSNGIHKPNNHVQDTPDLHFHAGSERV